MSTRSSRVLLRSGKVRRVVEIVWPAGGQTGRLGGGVVCSPFCHVHDFNLDRIFGAGVDTGRLEVLKQTTAAHVALANDATLRVDCGTE